MTSHINLHIYDVIASSLRSMEGRIIKMSLHVTCTDEITPVHVIACTDVLTCRRVNTRFPVSK